MNSSQTAEKTQIQWFRIVRIFIFSFVLEYRTYSEPWLVPWIHILSSGEDYDEIIFREQQCESARMSKAGSRIGNVNCIAIRACVLQNNISIIAMGIDTAQSISTKAIIFWSLCWVHLMKKSHEHGCAYTSVLFLNSQSCICPWTSYMKSDW